MAIHDVGDAVRIWTVFRDESGEQADPDAVTLRVRRPSGTVEAVTAEAAVDDDLELVNTALGLALTEATGVYKALIDADEAGLWRYAWTGTGAVQEVEASVFLVRADRVGDVEYA